MASDSDKACLARASIWGFRVPDSGAKTATRTVQDSHRGLWLAPQLSFWGIV